jgi:hypothetical protein
MLPVPVVALLVISALLVMLALIAAVLSYFRHYSDNQRQANLNQLAETLKTGWSDLNSYHKDVRELHDATITKLGVLGDKEIELRNWHGDLKAIDESIQLLDSVVGVFKFSKDMLGNISHESKVTGLVVTGVIMRHPDNHLNCTIVEQNETWITQHPRFVLTKVEEDQPK